MHGSTEVTGHGNRLLHRDTGGDLTQQIYRNRDVCLHGPMFVLLPGVPKDLVADLEGPRSRGEGAVPKGPQLYDCAGKVPAHDMGRADEEPTISLVQVERCRCYPFNVDEGFVCRRRDSVYLHDLEWRPGRDYGDCRVPGREVGCHFV